MKNKRFILGLILSFGIVFASCKKETEEIENNTIEVSRNTIVNSNISSNTTWTCDKIYELSGHITVLNGATLTIEPGTIIKGQAGTGTNSSALIIARGGKIMAEGTADKPIIFTSVADEISPEDITAGNFASPNLDPNIRGLWGGVLVLGKAQISASNEETGEQFTEIQIEGIPTSNPNGLYGGNNNDDNSGILKYISIRHGGTNIGSGNEINGLTLGGVGSGTIIDNIEIVANDDDGIEFFGGTVNITNVITWNVNDDGLDTDQAWAGSCNNFVIITPAGHCFELDGPEGSYSNDGHLFENGYVIASDADVTSGDLINVDDNTVVKLKNITFVNVVNGQKINKVTAPGVVFENIKIDVPADSLSNHINGIVPSGVSVGSNTQVDFSKFSWTWAHSTGKI
ncbi:MAG: hypothetical protein RBS19_03145 [Bacteroidales bacterium]|nr:hypothetical protein [Bacteroidales bacterium]MDY0215933.1 hypothetical protein [Bacteroidales bacterium]